MEGVVYEGWLVKSPPEKRILKAKWRQRWFVLRHSGLLPGQFILEYFTDDSCRKLKGKIDLDQCEQVDAGLTFEGKKTSYQFMFDIRTPKRIYYLVAETESDMNKWVDCICSVCGLKIHVEEDFLSQETAPQTGATSFTSTAASTNLTETKSASNPYIPISECHTGKPIMNGNIPGGGKYNDFPKEAPPPPPTPIQNDWSQHDPSLLREFYDFPKPITSVSGLDSLSGTLDTMLEASYKVPSSLHLTSSDVSACANGSKTLLPSVNWNTHPSDEVPKDKTSVSNDLVDALAAYDIVPPLNSTNKRKADGIHKDVRELVSQFEKGNIVEKTQEISNGISQQDQNAFKAPPRPPKPLKLRDHRHEYENFEPLHPVGKVDSLAYDIPQPPKEVPLSQLPSTQGVSSTAEEIKKDLTLATKVPLLSSSDSDKLLDDTYDFPKFRNEDSASATIPITQGSGTMQKQRRHAYSNAPPGLFNSKELIFNYEYRPSLLNDYVNLDASKQEHGASGGDTSPAQSTGVGPYVNLPASPSLLSGTQGDVPPAVDRGLKPRKNSDKGSFSFLTLQPPPLYKTRANKRSFRRPGERYMAGANSTLASGLNGTPPVPNRFRHHLDMSAMMDDDFASVSGSRHNSLVDEQTRHHFAGAPIKKDEIQYLDLDLDSEPSPSPKSPERVSATVYKKVDFVKTKVFNEMRQNVEESYRKSQ